MNEHPTSAWMAGLSLCVIAFIILLISAEGLSVVWPSFGEGWDEVWGLIFDNLFFWKKWL